MVHIRERKRKDGSKAYQFLIRNKSAGQVSKTFDRKSDGMMWAEDLAVDLRRGTQRVIQRARRVTVPEMIERYISETFHERRSPRTAKQTLNYWGTKLKSFEVSNLQKSDILNIWNELAKTPSSRTGKLLSPRSLNCYLETFSACLSYAVHLDLLNFNPCLGIRRKRLDNARRLDPLSKEQVEQLLRCASKSTNPYLRTAILLSLNTGGRRKEILGLQWEDVNLETGEIELKRTKNGRTRIVYLGSSVLEALRIHEAEYRTDSPLLFPSRKKRYRGTAATCSTEWEDLTSPFKKACTAAQLSLRWHDLRHVAASYLASLGATITETMMILGHTSTQMTHRYTHLFPAKSRALAESVSNNFLTFPKPQGA